MKASLSKDYSVLCAKSSKEAISIVKNNKLDLIVLDYLLDEMNGLQLQDALFNINNELKFIMISALSSVNVAVKSLKRGALDYLIKPIEPYILEHTIKSAFIYLDYIKEFQGEIERRNKDYEELKRYKAKYGELI